jgi:phage host-nuclease inhibitor protein Gam
MKSPRIKKQLSPTLTRSDIDLLLSDLQLTCANEQRILALKNEQIAKVEQSYALDLAALDTAKATLTGQIQRWAEANPAEFGKKKSIETPCGKFGFRTGTPKLSPLNRKWTWASILAAMKSNPFWAGWVRIKEEVDKEKILADARPSELSTDLLATVGIRVTQDETFFIEPKLEQSEPRTTTTTPIPEAA